MPSQFQPNYPHPLVQQAAQAQAAGGGSAVKSLGDLAQAIQKARAAQTLTNQQGDPDPDWLYTGASPSAPGSYY